MFSILPNGALNPRYSPAGLSSTALPITVVRQRPSFSRSAYAEAVPDFNNPIVPNQTIQAYKWVKVIKSGRGEMLQWPEGVAQKLTDLLMCNYTAMNVPEPEPTDLQFLDQIVDSLGNTYRVEAAIDDSGRRHHLFVALTRLSPTGDLGLAASLGNSSGFSQIFKTDFTKISSPVDPNFTSIWQVGYSDQGPPGSPAALVHGTNGLFTAISPANVVFDQVNGMTLTTEPSLGTYPYVSGAVTTLSSITLPPLPNQYNCAIKVEATLKVNYVTNSANMAAWLKYFGLIPNEIDYFEATQTMFERGTIFVSGSPGNLGLPSYREPLDNVDLTQFNVFGVQYGYNNGQPYTQFWFNRGAGNNGQPYGSTSFIVQHPMTYLLSCEPNVVPDRSPDQTGSMSVSSIEAYIRSAAPIGGFR